MAEDGQKESFLHLLYLGLLLNRKLPSRLHLGVAGLDGKKSSKDGCKFYETIGELHIRSSEITYH